MNTVVTSREAILAASTKIARNEGLGAISMRSVAAACGIAVGSVYNYFPGKGDLITATVEALWQEVFHAQQPCTGFEDFCQCVRWLFTSIQASSNAYPGLFSSHALGFTAAERQKGRQVMGQSFAHMKQGLLIALMEDGNLRADAFGDAFTMQQFVDFVFGNLLMLLSQNAADCELLCQVIRRCLY